MQGCRNPLAMKRRKTERIMSGTVDAVLCELLKRLRLVDVPNPAVAFDVDDTLILWQPDSDAVARHPVVARFFEILHEKHEKHDMQSFIITARTKTLKGYEYMLDQLRGCGVNVEGKIPPGGIYMTPKKFVDDDHAGRFKYCARKHIQRKFGVQMLVMVGDQWWDIFEQGEAPEAGLNPDHAHLYQHPDNLTMFGVKLPAQ